MQVNMNWLEQHIHVPAAAAAAILPQDAEAAADDISSLITHWKI
jgi:hypothetical protein